MGRPDRERPPAAVPPLAEAFETTRWGLVLAAADRASPGADEALAALCSAYWYPVYAFVRHRTRDADRAADLTQGFFARLIEKSDLRAADPARGRFRSFLLTACRHFLANEHDRETARKRGGGRCVVSIDRRDAEGRYLIEPAHAMTPEHLFERRWALALLERALDELGREYRAAGKGPLFEHLKASLTGDDAGASHAEAGRALGMTEAAVKKAAQRLRRAFREAIRRRILETVDDPGLVDDEIRSLFAALAT
ncbi:RNA polymerase sigma factor [Aquisphaera giovannonii]|uniref:RNA polymerase sigma factor n=1 Tax=Aquisphaera giovannonii TaxID=406548 RepID=A0A5B9VTM7_9BACT|nr:sigma-70 family RNA polymerase sigma factor [Aquisphaera giovannonii]QEH31638.1 RNA polymerase sigma factor [Aquisphaera giovannonii]